MEKQVNGQNGHLVVYSPETAAEILGVFPSFIRHEIRLGKLKAFKGGKTWRITHEDLVDYTQSKKESDTRRKQVREDTKKKLRYRAKARSEENWPAAERRIREKIEEIKARMKGKSEARRIAALKVLQETLMTKIEREHQQENLPGEMRKLENQVYAGMRELLNLDPDEAEQKFLEQLFENGQGQAELNEMAQRVQAFAPNN